MKYKSLSEADKLIFREELKHNSEKEFDEEFIRSTNLERKLINEYGFEGIKLIFENRNSTNYFLLGEFPKDCPWVKNNKEQIEKVIEINFSKIKNKLPDLISSMKERCKFIYAEKEKNKWKLHYLMEAKLHDKRDYYRVYTGGMPINNSIENENLLKFGWTLPKDLKEFYTIHNGFGEIDELGYILNMDEIRVMGEMMNPICEEQNVKPEEYSFDNLLEFFPDGAGNAQCFLRGETGNNVTVDWDHEIWELSNEESFYEFINERLAEIDEE
jgi:hypothetical protein